ncbi:MAG: hypothetical protein AAGA56_01675 [Myxococcota bacterium]
MVWRTVAAGIAFFLIGCATKPPTGWHTGAGAVLLAPRARWVLDGLLVDVMPDGTVLLNGEPQYAVDAAGRVYDAYNRPVALLDKEGYVHGPDDRPLGWVGAFEAIPPGRSEPWLSLGGDGLLARQRPGSTVTTSFGLWQGCRDARVSQTCVLLSHILGRDLEERRARARSRVGVGVGVGVGVPLR